MRLLSLSILFFFCTFPLFSAKIPVNFTRKYVEIDLSHLTINNFSINKKDSRFIIYVQNNLKKNYIPVNYKVLKTILIKNNKIIIILNNERNYTFKKAHLKIYYTFPQYGIVKKRSYVKSKPDNKSFNSTELLMGNEVIVKKAKGKWLYIAIPSQMNYEGWIKAKNIDMLFRKDKKKPYPFMIQSKFSVFISQKHGKIKLPAGTEYRIIRKEKNKNYIELKNGEKGYLTIKKTKYKKDDIRTEIIKTAKKFIGIRYVWGGISSYGMDCSGLVYTVYKLNGIKVPRDASDQYKFSKKIFLKDAKKGDLLFFQTYKSGASHVGIYIGNGKFIEASVSKGVTISSLKTPYYKKRFLGVGRIIK